MLKTSTDHLNGDEEAGGGGGGLVFGGSGGEDLFVSYFLIVDSCICLS